jgi:hypothetical protein
MSAAKDTYVISVTRRINASPRVAYDTIANYHTGHPRIVPKQISNIHVERGGIGAGTVITFDVTVLGRTTPFRAEVTEPEPGRVLVETNVQGNESFTTFVVDPGAHPNEAVVTIRTEMTRQPGLAGAIEKLLSPRLLKPMYEEELRRLEAAAADPHGTAASGSARG